MTEIFETFSVSETINLGKQFAKNAKEGDIYCLCGDIGAGKTHFTKGFALGLSIDEDITSPTFTIVNEYKGRLKLYHFDVYRIEEIYEMDDTGYEDMFFSNGVCLIEWAEIIKEIIPENAVWIYFERDFNKDCDYRKIIVKRNQGEI